jgi:hypothetical protein
MRLPPTMKAVLSKLARQRTTDATTLARSRNCWNGNLERDEWTHAPTVLMYGAVDVFLNRDNID